MGKYPEFSSNGNFFYWKGGKKMEAGRLTKLLAALTTILHTEKGQGSLRCIFVGFSTRLVVKVKDSADSMAVLLSPLNSQWSALFVFKALSRAQ